MKRLIVLILILSSTTFAADYPEITLDKLISKLRQKEMGLDKLTHQERNKLRLYIIEMYLRGIGKGKEQGEKKARSGGPSYSTSSVIESQIEDDFEGWEGETIVKLMNGQIWQQVEYHYHYHYAFMPKVIIYRSGGMYKMKVDGIEKAVGVVQLK